MADEMTVTQMLMWAGFILVIFLILRWNFSRQVKKKEKEVQVQEQENAEQELQQQQQ